MAKNSIYFPNKIRSCIVAVKPLRLLQHFVFKNGEDAGACCFLYDVHAGKVAKGGQQQYIVAKVEAGQPVALEAFVVEQAAGVYVPGDAKGAGYRLFGRMVGEEQVSRYEGIGQYYVGFFQQEFGQYVMVALSQYYMHTRMIVQKILE